MTKSKRRPVLVITDIGADIDDTLALFALLGALDVVKVIAFVTCVNDGLKRGALLRGFLRTLGYPDNAFPILPFCDHNTAGCYIPESFPTIENANIGKLEDTPKMILDLCAEHSDEGVYILGIAGLTPLARAIDLDEKRGNILSKAVSGLYLQGNCRVSKSDGNVRLDPLDIAYNFRVDMEAARKVFDFFQGSVPFVLLGKFAAYQVPVTKHDFKLWTEKLKTARELQDSSSSTPTPLAPDLLDIVTEQMKMFRSKRPDLFDGIYKVPNNLTEEKKQSFCWFQSQRNSFVCSHPYDPLLAFWMIQDLVEEKHERISSMFRTETVINKGGVRHILLGNHPTSNSVTQVDALHSALFRLIAKGISPHQVI